MRYLNRKSVYFYYLLSFCFLILCLAGTGCSGQDKSKILLLDYLTVMDTIENHPTPEVYASMHYLVKGKKRDKVSLQDLQEFIAVDTTFANAISKKYFRMDVYFYTESENTERVERFKSFKALTLCNDDIFAEFDFIKGELSHTYLYQNGVIIGAEKIELK